MKFGGNFGKILITTIAFTLIGVNSIGALATTGPGNNYIVDPNKPQNNSQGNNNQGNGGNNSSEDLTILCQNTPKDPQCEQLRIQKNKQDQDANDKINEILKKNKTIQVCMYRNLSNYLASKNIPSSSEGRLKSDISSLTDRSFIASNKQIDENLKDLKSQCEKNSSLTIEPTDDGNDTECAVQYFGWIICPGARIGTSVVIGIYSAMAKNLLEIKSAEIFNTNGGAFTYWVIFRDIANVLLAIIVAVIVFSQSTNLGISNYGIKKMLPRLIIFAVIINISFWLVAGLVDLSNIIGYWSFDSLSGMDGWNAQNTLDSDVDSLLRGKASMGGEFATGVLVAGVGLVTALSGALLAMILIAMVALFLMFVILTGRQAVVIMLLVVSPIAFASAILPNTDGFFNKWKSFLKSMLMIYPICSLMIGGLILTSDILYEMAVQDKNVAFQVIYGLLPMIGLFAAYSVIKGTLSLIDKITGGTGTLSGMLKNIEKGGMGIAKDNRLVNMNKNLGGRLGLNARKGLDKFVNGKSVTGLGIRKNTLGRLYNMGTTARLKQQAYEADQKIYKQDQEIASYERKGVENLTNSERGNYSRLMTERRKRKAQETTDGAERIKSSISDVKDYANMLTNAIQSGNSELAKQIFQAAHTDTNAGGKVKKEVNQAMIDNLNSNSINGNMGDLLKFAQSEFGGKIKEADAVQGKSLSNLIQGQDSYSSQEANVQTLQERENFAAKLNQEVYSNMSNVDLSKQFSLETWAKNANDLPEAQRAKEVARANQILADDKLLQSMTDENIEHLQKVAGMTVSSSISMEQEYLKQEAEMQKLKTNLKAEVSAGRMTDEEYNQRVATAQKLANQAAEMRLYQDARKEQSDAEDISQQARNQGNLQEAKDYQEIAQKAQESRDYWNQNNFR